MDAMGQNSPLSTEDVPEPVLAFWKDHASFIGHCLIMLLEHKTSPLADADTSQLWVMVQFEISNPSPTMHYSDYEFALFNDIAKSHGYPSVNLSASQTVAVLSEVLRVAENPTPEELQQRKGFLQEVTPSRVASIRRSIEVWRDGNHAPLDPGKVA